MSLICWHLILASFYFTLRINEIQEMMYEEQYMPRYTLKEYVNAYPNLENLLLEPRLLISPLEIPQSSNALQPVKRP